MHGKTLEDASIWVYAKKDVWKMQGNDLDTPTSIALKTIARARETHSAAASYP